eukprot:UN09304
MVLCSRKQPNFCVAAILFTYAIKKYYMRECGFYVE